MSPSKKRLSFQTLGQTIVTVKVSSEAKPFNIHKDLLCQYSAYFRKAFNGSFKEAQEGAITLNDVSVQTFRGFMDWLYTQELTPGEDDVRTSDGDDTEGDTSRSTIENAKTIRWDFNSLLNLYVLGDRYDVPGLRNAVVDSWQAILEDENIVPSPTTVASAYEKLPYNSSLCRLLTQIIAYEWELKPGGDVKHLYKLPKEFLADVMVIMASRHPRRLEDEKAPYEEDRCAFHDHKDEAEATVCRQSRK